MRAATPRAGFAGKGLLAGSGESSTLFCQPQTEQALESVRG